MYHRCLVFLTLIDSNDEFTSVNGVLKEYNDMKKAVKAPKIINSGKI